MRKHVQSETHLTRWLGFVCAIFLTWCGASASQPAPPVFTEIGRDILGMGRIAQSRFAIADVDGDGLEDVIFTGDVFAPALLAIGKRADGSIGFKQILPLDREAPVALRFTDWSDAIPAALGSYH
jgi:hypothetical protein